jgi:hypothetical protein
MQFFKDLLIILFVTLLLLVGLEIGARAFYVDLPNPPPRKVSHFAYAYHPVYGITMRPNTEKTFQRTQANGGQNITWRTNRFGHRGKSAPDSIGFKLMVFGDSNVQGRFSIEDSTYCKQVEKALDTAGIENPFVINTGIVGLGPDQVLLKMREELPIHRPDFLIVHLFADNDFGDLIRNRLFELDENEKLVATNFHINLDQHIHPLPPEEKPASYLLFWLNNKRNEYFPADPQLAPPKDELQELQNLYMEWCKGEIAAYKAGLPRQYSHFGDHYDLDMAIAPESEVAQLKTKLMRAVLEGIQQTAKEHHLPLLMVILPSTMDMSTNFNLNHTIYAKHKAYRREYLSTTMEQLCTELNIPAINLWHPFLKNNPDSLYFVHPDNHWNDNGQRLAAQITAKRVVEMLR